ncbi:MAG: DNA primase [Thermosphaera sp.]|nr:DNA primase [Thermosphaera sp.]
MSTRINYTHYPFSATQRDFPGLFVEKPSILVSTSSELRARLLNMLKGVLDGGEISMESTLDPEESVLFYYALLDVLKSIGDSRVVSRVALAYSKTASKYLSEEKGELLVLLANKLGLNAGYETSDYPRIPRVLSGLGRVSVKMVSYQYSLPINQYLELVSKRLLHDPTYSLVNYFIWSGRVYVDRSTFIRILEEHIYNTIINHVAQAEPPEAVDYSSLIEEVRSIVSKYYEKIAAKPRVVEGESKSPYLPGGGLVLIEDLFPPCMKKVVEALKTGGNPSHVERFNLAAFLGQIGLGADEVLDYFRNTPDFNEKIARYQVEHILGLRGGRKKYMPYGCEKLKSIGICPITEQCKGGKNPLAVYKYNLREYFKKRGEEEKEA